MEKLNFGGRWVWVTMNPPPPPSKLRDGAPMLPAVSRCITIRTLWSLCCQMGTNSRTITARRKKTPEALRVAPRILPRATDGIAYAVFWTSGVCYCAVSSAVAVGAMSQLTPASPPPSPQRQTATLLTLPPATGAGGVQRVYEAADV